MSNDTDNDEAASLVVLHTWARMEFLNLCLAIGRADTEEAKRDSFDRLKTEASRLVAIFNGIDAVAFTTAEKDRFDVMEGQLEIAKELFSAILKSTQLSPALTSAILEWNSDIADSVLALVES